MCIERLRVNKSNALKEPRPIIPTDKDRFKTRINEIQKEITGFTANEYWVKKMLTSALFFDVNKPEFIVTLYLVQWWEPYSQPQHDSWEPWISLSSDGTYEGFKDHVSVKYYKQNLDKAITKPQDDTDWNIKLTRTLYYRKSGKPMREKTLTIQQPLSIGFCRIHYEEQEASCIECIQAFNLKKKV